MVAGAEIVGKAIASIGRRVMTFRFLAQHDSVTIRAMRADRTIRFGCHSSAPTILMLLTLLLTPGLSASADPSCVNWSESLLPSRASHAMAYDSARGRTILFGGIGGSFLGDTVEWDGTTWTQRVPATSPSARTYHAMAYDSARGVTILFGGANGSYLGDTWEFGIPAPNADMNVSGSADGSDISPFVTALLDASTVSSDLCHADFNANGVIDLDDVPGFTQKLLGS